MVMRRPSSQCVRAPPPSRDTFVQGVYAACFCGMSWILQPPQFPRRKGEPCGEQPWASLNQDNVLTRAHCAAHVHVLPSCQPSKDPWAFPADAAGGAANGSLASPPESPVPPSLSGSFVQLALWLVSAATVKGGVPHWPGKQKILPPTATRAQGIFRAVFLGFQCLVQVASMASNDGCPQPEGPAAPTPRRLCAGLVSWSGHCLGR